MEPRKDTAAYRLRTELGLTTTAAAGLAGVSKRTWEMYESGTLAFPESTAIMFALKAQKEAPPPPKETVVIVANDGMTPIDAVRSDTFYDLLERPDGQCIVWSLAVNRDSGRPYIHQMPFRADVNQYALKKLRTWPRHRPQT